MSVSRRVFAETLRDFFRPIDALLRDETISEILINAHDEVYVERAGALQKVDAHFGSEMDLDAALTNLAQSVGRTLGAGSPLLEASLPDGSRLQAVLPPAAVNGPCVAIRCARARALTIESFLLGDGQAKPAAAYLRDTMKKRRNVLICGGSGAGKTTLLGAVLSETPPNTRVVTVERSAELGPRAAHVVKLVARSSEDAAASAARVTELLRAALRMRPDCVAVGDLRGPEAVELVRSMSSAAAQFVATLSVSRPTDALCSLEAMLIEGSPGHSASALSRSLACALDVIVHVVRASDGRRRIAQIVEVLSWTEDRGYRLEDVVQREELP